MWLKAYSSGCAVGQPAQYYVNMRDAEAKKRRAAEKIERQLDEALENTFPASDPVAIATGEDQRAQAVFTRYDFS
ncbi:MAG: hypothetical protein PVS2B3_07920 [Steroidobacteraceae bacterium]